VSVRVCVSVGVGGWSGVVDGWVGGWEGGWVRGGSNS